ncbi:MAG: AraC family ligand binding domain-containing protein [Bacteroidota bacterium]
MKPVQFSIPKTQDTSFHVQKDEARNFYDRLHQHPEWQITAIHKGKGILFAGNSSTSFQAGDVFMLGSNTPHLFKNAQSPESEIETEVCSISVFFGKDSFGKEFFTLPELKQLSEYLRQAKRGILFMGKEKEVLFQQLSSFPQKQGIELLIDLLSMLKCMMNIQGQGFINSEH